MSIYAFLPIIHISNRFLSGSPISKMPKLDFDITSGYDEVIYNKDGVNVTSNALSSDGGYKKSKSEFRIILDKRLSKRSMGKFSVVGVNGRTNNTKYYWLRSNNLILDKNEIKK